MKLSDLQNKKIVIIGYGKEGKDVEAFLKAQVKTSVVDHIDIADDPDYLKKQSQYDFAIRSPGVKKELITIPYTTATNLFFSLVKGPVIGVTGTKGKSTTASLIHSILKEAGMQVHLVGNIGNPMLTQLSYSQNTEKDYWVFELSSYQLDDIAYSPHISVIINLYPEHMDYHGSVEQYWQAKKRIVAHAKNKDFFVYNLSFEELRKLAQHTKAKPIPCKDTVPFALDGIHLMGKHNVDNIRIAYTVSQLLQIPLKSVEKAVQTFRPLEHRMELVGTFKGITFYNDAISTTPQSTLFAIETLEKIGTIFLGGQNRGYDFATLAEKILEYQISNIVLFPDSGEAILDALKSCGVPNSLRIFETESMEEAVRFAYEYTPRDMICLLSTASPSYSVWKNFEEKGKLFKEYVLKLSR